MFYGKIKPNDSCLLSKGLVTNYEEGLQNGRGGHVKFYPYQKGGGGSFSQAEKVLG